MGKAKQNVAGNAVEHDDSKCKGTTKNGHHQWGGAHHPSKRHLYLCKNDGCEAKGHFDPATGSILEGAPKSAADDSDE